MKIILDIEKLNEDKFKYLNEIFDDYDGDDYDSLYSYLSYKQDLEIIIRNYTFISDFSSSIIRLFNDVNEDYNNLNLSYEEKESKQKIILDIERLNKEGHDYLKELFDFPDYYGKNLDALYDCLGDMDDTEVIIINLDELNEQSIRILSVFDDAADDFDNIKLSYEEE